jgi:AcrR family transcriptional regulator
MAEARPREPDPALGGRGESVEAVQARILRAAQARFVRYGFGKTTMTEIAADCAMSAANIYRYFESKGDIAAAGARRWLGELEGELAALAAEPPVPPAARLARLVLAKIGALSALIADAPHLEELVDHVCREREDVMADHRQAVRALYAAVIRAGQGEGAFAPGDPERAAEAFDAATRGFFHPAVLRAQPPNEIRAEAEKALALLLAGLRAGVADG